MINIITRETSDVLPKNIVATQNPTLEQCLAAGWRKDVPEPELQDGYTRLSRDPFVEGDGVYHSWVVVDRLTSEIEAENEAAKAATLPIEKASMFRAILRRNFGPEAETNRNITAEYVEGYFALSQGLTGDQVRDGLFLRELFETLAEWNGTGETWTIYEKYGEVIP